MLAIWERYGGRCSDLCASAALPSPSTTCTQKTNRQTTCIGPVNKVLNMLSAFHATGGDVQAPAFKKHLRELQITYGSLRMV